MTMKTGLRGVCVRPLMDALERCDEQEPGETPLVAFLGRPVGLKWRLL